MYCSRLHAWWSTRSRLATLLSSLIARRWVGLQTLWRFLLKYLSIYEMVRAWCLGCCQAHRVLPVGFPLLWYSVLFTVESLSLLYLLFISWFICSSRWCIDTLGVFHATKHLCVLIHIWTKGEVGAGLNRFKPSSKIFLLAVPRRCFFCGSLMLFLSCFVMLSCTSVCWCPAGKGLTYWLSFMMSNCDVVTFPLAFWVRCGAWMYRFLIFALFLILYAIFFSGEGAKASPESTTKR